MRKVLRLICRPPGRIVRDADRYPELRLRRRVHDGAVGRGRRRRQARPDDPARRQAASARGVLALRAALMRSSLAFSCILLVAMGSGAGEADWAGFVAREMAPRFPDGLTITDAVGERRDPETGGTAEEPSKHVEIVLPGNADGEARLDAVVAAYKREF